MSLFQVSRDTRRNRPFASTVVTTVDTHSICSMYCSCNHQYKGNIARGRVPVPRREFHVLDSCVPFGFCCWNFRRYVHSARFTINTYLYYAHHAQRDGRFGMNGRSAYGPCSDLRRGSLTSVVSVGAGFPSHGRIRIRFELTPFSCFLLLAPVQEAPGHTGQGGGGGGNLGTLRVRAARTFLNGPTRACQVRHHFLAPM